MITSGALGSRVAVMVADGDHPMGVLVKVAVAVGKGVMLGKGVIVIAMVSACVGVGCVAIAVMRGADVRKSARLVAVRLMEGKLGAGAVAGSVVTHADAASNTASAIKSGLFALFMARPA